jgi:hypothetical protein
MKVKLFLSSLRRRLEGGWGGFTTPLLLNVHTELRWVVDFTPRFIYPRERTSVFDGPRTRYGLFVDERNILLPLGFELKKARSVVSMPAMLSHWMFSKLIMLKKWWLAISIISFLVMAVNFIVWFRTIDVMTSVVDQLKSQILEALLFQFIFDSHANYETKFAHGVSIVWFLVHKSRTYNAGWC